MKKEEGQNHLRPSDQDLLRFLSSPLKRMNGHETGAAPIMENGGCDSCPEVGIYLELAMGERSPEESEWLLDHAAQCQRCGKVLGQSIHSLDGNPSDEEAEAIANLAAQRHWQSEVATTLAATASQSGEPHRFFAFEWGKQGTQSRIPPTAARSWITGGVVAAGLAGGLAAGGWVFWQKQANSAEHQLAMAYSESRTLELRIPEAQYAQMTPNHHTRGTDADHESSVLLKARAKVVWELQQSPEDEHWLELRARADLLEERYDYAIEVLDRLISAGNPSPETLTDAATAYYERGLVSGRELDRSTALDYLKRADEMTPADPVILFNEAKLMEDRGQMMNAVEVWNRYLAVERDPKWAAEGKRKLTALEQTLNQFKSHQGRVNEMLSTPAAMEALANDQQKLKKLDEELVTYELDKLLPAAYPIDQSGAAIEATARSVQPRASPCDHSCAAARHLIQQIGKSLELKHQDYWISDLVPTEVNALPPDSAAIYKQALGRLSRAVREDSTGSPNEAANLAEQSRGLFERLDQQAQGYSVLSRAFQVGEERAGLEYLFALQRQVNFKAAREYAGEIQTGPLFRHNGNRYPWMAAAKLITLKVIDDTPETRTAGANMLSAASSLATDHHYPLLMARIAMRQADSQEAAGDLEAATHLTEVTFHQLWAEDEPAIRMVATIGEMPYIEEHSPRARSREGYLRETVGWFELINSRTDAAQARMELARCEIGTGAFSRAEKDLADAEREGLFSADGKRVAANFSESDIMLANSYLENGDWTKASLYLDKAATYMASYSDSWGLRKYAAARGQLDLAKGKLDEASSTLEAEIRSSEGTNAPADDSSNTSKFSQQDHDLYAELAATWLAQGKSPDSVLALWSRFQSRSHGQAVASCRGMALDCDVPRLLAVQRELGDSLVIGQVVLLDRVLVYTMDKDKVQWSQKALGRKSLIDSAQRLELAVSSPLTSAGRARDLGMTLAKQLLPVLPAKLSSDGLLLLAADPMLQNLSWPVLPTSAGAIGLQYPLVELRSILGSAVKSRPDERSGQFQASLGRPVIVGASTAAVEEAPLPEALTEANAIAVILKPADLVIGAQATTVRLTQLLHSATIFHFAGHAIQTKEGTELLLAAASAQEKSPWIDGAYLRKHPPLVCRLAVLSACSTGVRDASWNDPLSDMVETFVALGVPDVVATRWPVDSEASVPFMEEFYRNLRRGDNVSIALMRARVIQSQQSQYSNPYYWAAYYVTGRENPNFAGELYAKR